MSKIVKIVINCQYCQKLSKSKNSSHFQIFQKILKIVDQVMSSHLHVPKITSF